MENNDPKNETSQHHAGQDNADMNVNSFAEKTIDVDLQIKLEKELERMRENQNKFNLLISHAVVASGLAFFAVIVAVVLNFMPHTNQPNESNNKEWSLSGWSLSFGVASLIQIISVGHTLLTLRRKFSRKESFASKRKM